MARHPVCPAMTLQPAASARCRAVASYSMMLLEQAMVGTVRCLHSLGEYEALDQICRTLQRRVNLAEASGCGRRRARPGSPLHSNTTTRTQPTLLLMTDRSLLTARMPRRRSSYFTLRGVAQDQRRRHGW